MAQRLLDAERQLQAAREEVADLGSKLATWVTGHLARCWPAAALLHCCRCTSMRMRVHAALASGNICRSERAACTGAREGRRPLAAQQPSTTRLAAELLKHSPVLAPGSCRL